MTDTKVDTPKDTNDAGRPIEEDVANEEEKIGEPGIDDRSV